MDCSPPGSSVHGILQARILEWVYMSSRGSPWPRDQTLESCIAGRFFTIWATRDASGYKKDYDTALEFAFQPSPILYVSFTANFLRVINICPLFSVSIYSLLIHSWNSLSGAEVKNLPAKAGDIGDIGLIPGWGRSPGGGNDYPLEYS